MWSTHWAVDVPPANHIGPGGLMSTRLAEQWGVPTIALATSFLALVGVTHLLLRWWVRRQSRRALMTLAAAAPVVHWPETWRLLE
jgi:uncharacterized membrane protein YdcZ (DUF606 family)